MTRKRSCSASNPRHIWLFHISFSFVKDATDEGNLSEILRFGAVKSTGCYLKLFLSLSVYKYLRPLSFSFESKLQHTRHISIGVAGFRFISYKGFQRISEGGRVVRWCWVNFQCRGVLLIWIMVGQGPIAIAVGAGGGLFGHFFSRYPFFLSSFSLSLGDGPI